MSPDNAQHINIDVNKWKQWPGASYLAPRPTAWCHLCTFHDM